VTSLAELSSVTPDAVAVDDGCRLVTWAELDARSTALGNGIEALGATRGSHVVICVSNRAEFVEAVLGAWRAGCAFTPVKTGWTATEIGAVLDDAATRIVITDRAGARDAGRERGIPIVDLDDGFEAWLGGQPDEPLSDDRCGYKLAYTSGTTGRPKGVVMAGSGTTTFAAGWLGIARWAERLALPDTGIHLFLSRLFNGAPQTFGFGAMARGATLRIMRQWEPVEALAALGAGDVTSTIMVPTMFRQLLAIPDIDHTVTPAPALRTILHGGEPCPAPLKAAIADWFGEVLVEYYGFTEGGMTIVGAGEWRGRPGTVGRPTTGMSVRILDEAGADLGPNTEGTVYFQSTGGRRFHYQGDAEKTTGAHLADSDAFTVGDVGWLDDDGFLYICGRRADLVVSAGVNVYPAEIEQALTDVAGIADLCAVGGPDADRGEVIILHISLLPGADRDAVLAAITEAATNRLAPYKRPRTVHVVDDVPRDGTDKLLRRVLRDPLWADHEQFAAAAPDARGSGGPTLDPTQA
jgi:long-chain acyl-CoA synthetase